MKTWQRLWLSFVFIISTLHLFRDIFQSLGLVNPLSAFLASPGPPKVPYVLYYTIYNTFVWEIGMILIAYTCLKRRHFGKLGRITMISTLTIFCLWLHYYFVL